MDDYKGLLKAAFAETDTLSYGPFKITKKPGAPWRHATVLIDGKTVVLPPLKKQLLALLISQQGKNVTMDDFSASLPKSNPSIWYEIAKKGEDTQERRGARAELKNTLKVNFSQMKKALRDQDIPESTIDMIRCAGYHRASGAKGAVDPSLTGAYRLHIGPSP